MEEKKNESFNDYFIFFNRIWFNFLNDMEIQQGERWQ